MKINEIYLGHVLDILKQLPDNYVDCCITSPPYWALRDYQLEAQIWDGDERCEHQWGGNKIIKSGSNWDSFAEYRIDGGSGKREIGMKNISQGNFCSLCNAWRGSLGLEPTIELYVSHLVQIFREVRRVLKEEGTLWLNLGDSYIGNCSRASSGGRAGFGTPREGVFKHTSYNLKPKNLCGIPWRVAFALQADGWWLRQDIIWSKPNPMPESIKDRCTKSHEYIFLLTKSSKYHFDAKAIKETAICGGRTIKASGDSAKNAKKGKYGQTAIGFTIHDTLIEKRNKRSIWVIPTQPFPGAHFAVFPEALVGPMVKAGCPPDGIVLDPFMGSGTVGVVTKKFGRNYIGIEIKPEYIVMAQKRINEIMPLFT